MADLISTGDCYALEKKYLRKLNGFCVAKGLCLMTTSPVLPARQQMRHPQQLLEELGDYPSG